MITSKDNERLKLIRKLAERRHRRRTGLFVAEGEDLVDAAAAAGRTPEFVLRAGEDVEAGLLAEASSLGSGARVIGVYRELWVQTPSAPCVYLHGVGDPGNVGAVIRTAHALVEGTVVLGPGCADPHAPKAIRASMGSIFGQPIARGEVDVTPAPRIGLVAAAGEAPDDAEVATLCLGAEREGLPEGVVSRCERLWTIPLRPHGAESLNVAAAAAIALGRISSAAPGEPPGGAS